MWRKAANKKVNLHQRNRPKKSIVSLVHLNEGVPGQVVDLLALRLHDRGGLGPRTDSLSHTTHPPPHPRHPRVH